MNAIFCASKIQNVSRITIFRRNILSGMFSPILFLRNKFQLKLCLRSHELSDFNTAFFSNTIENLRQLFIRCEKRKYIFNSFLLSGNKSNLLHFSFDRTNQKKYAKTIASDGYKNENTTSTYLLSKLRNNKIRFFRLIKSFPQRKFPKTFPQNNNKKKSTKK